MTEGGAHRLDAVVLAGRENKGRLTEISSEPWEALIDVKGKPLVRYPVEALRGAKLIRRIVVVGPKPELERVLADLDVDVVPPGAGLLDNVLTGCRRVAELNGGKTGLVLVASGDLPLITPEIIDDLVCLCLGLGGDVFYPVLERSVMEAKFPGTRRTYAGLRDGTYTGGNVFLVDVAVIEKERAKAEALVAARKNPLQMAQILGFGFLLRLLLKRLAVADLERHVSERFGIAGRALPIPWAEVGIDVDKPADYELVLQFLSGTRG